MKKRMKQLMALGMVLTMSLGMLSGCGNDAGTATDKVNEASQSVTESTSADAASEETEQSEEAEPVEVPVLTVYMPANEQADLELVEAEANKILEAEIGAKVDMIFLPSGAFKEKMNLMLATQEQFDICFTSNWLNNYMTGVNNGCYVPLNDLIDEYCPELWDEMPQYWWDGVTVDGEVYFVPNQQAATSIGAVCIDKKWVDKYHLDTDSVETIDDLEPFMQLITMNESDVYAYQPWGNFWATEFESITTGVGLDTSASGYKAVFEWENEGYVTYYKTMRDWYEKGYIRSDVASIVDDNADYLAGKYVVTGLSYRPGNEATQATKLGIEPVILELGSKSKVSAGSVQGAGYAISNTCEHPDKAILFINEMNTNVELFNLFAYGIEGKHYNWVDEDHIALVAQEQSGYYLNASWKFGNVFNGYVLEGMPVDVYELSAEENNQAEKSALFGFKFDSSNVKVQLTQMATVVAEYKNLTKGAVDFEENFDAYVQKMIEAGAEDVKAEVQRQLDEYAKTNPRQ